MCVGAPKKRDQKSYKKLCKIAKLQKKIREKIDRATTQKL